MDQVFTKLPTEWWHGQEMSSAHDADSIKPFDLPYSYVLFCYPRDGTAVCNAELIDLQQKLGEFNLDVIVASTDSPETHNKFFNDEEAFDPKLVPNIEYPVLTLRDYLLTDLCKQLIMSEFGYCKRIAIVVFNGTIKSIYETDNNVQRDISLLIKLTQSVTSK